MEYTMPKDKKDASHLPLDANGKAPIAKGPNAKKIVADQLAAGYDISQLNVPRFTELPGNLTFTIGSDAEHKADALPPGTELPSDFKEDTSPAHANIELGPAPSALEGQAPIMSAEFYRKHTYGAPYSSTLLDNANKLAGIIWGDRTQVAQQRHAQLPGQTPEETLAVFVKNANQYSHHPVNQRLQKLLAIVTDQTQGPGFHPISYDHYVTTVIRKLKRLERKYNSDDLLNDESRERIIENVLLPSNSFGVEHGYTGDYVDLQYPPQRAITLNLLTKEDFGYITSALNFLPRVRYLLKLFDGYGGPVTKEELLKPLKPEVANQYYGQREEDQQFLDALKKVHAFMFDAIPYEVSADFELSPRGQPLSGKYYEEVRKASQSLRETAMRYIQEAVELSDLLEAIYALSGKLIQYFSELNEEVRKHYDFLNRVGISFEQLVEESKDRLSHDNTPW